MYEFSYTDIVVLSCGTNDITRHQYSAQALSQFLVYKLREYSVRFPNVIFVVNSLLYTTDKYFNREISIYNSFIFEFSMDAENVWFFDSHYIVVNGPNPIDTWGNGIHITHNAKKKISTVLRECIIKAANHEHDLHRVWPLRPVYRRATF